MGKYGDGLPGVHNTGPVVSEEGFRVGNKDSSTEVIDSEGRYNSALLSESLADYDVISGGSIDVTSAATTVLIDAGAEAYEVVILVRVTTVIADDPAVEVGFNTDNDAFGTLTVTAVGATQIFSGESDAGENVTIVSDGDGTGVITYVILAKELE